MSSRTRQRRSLHVAFPIFAVLLTFLAANLAWARVPLSPQGDPETLFNQGVAAYNQNQFPQALEKFQKVSGPHAQEAQQYINKMKAYQDAMEVAKSAMDRSPDEQDANNLAFAIQQYEKAIKIKADGPWNPNEKLAKARDMKTAVENAHAAASKAMDTEFCAKALAASQEHHYKEAAQYSCAVANDNPGYSCGGDEAVHVCQLNTDMAKMQGTAKIPSGTQPESVASSTGLDKGQAAYNSNDFERARTLLQRVDPGSKPAATEFLDKISRYTDAVANGEKLARGSQYDAARTAFLSAAAIKADGPGDPRNRAATMELFQGLDQFYAGDYPSAIQHLQSCAQAGTQKQPLIHFYLGASELAKFFVTGGEDATLHQEALNDLKLAKQAGFKTTGQDVSPKILQVYKDLSF
ncbi:MAG TPA: hypothetical protein VFE61_01210 [Candidatus Sulfotelmatobacter sp.]|nr:hypothetical protein [Candidatus Sulfotelmatobacter sp.]